ncbi:MAG: mechanosensitive ion channel family protein [Bacteroidia bacterium]|nr:mechanosensitive ion channel family protein [Bacteroidia bacterium]NND51611.1 mechanosensitive ion channel [Flavobacteriaceae bacterium]
MLEFFNTHKSEIINSFIVFIILMTAYFVVKITIRKIGQKNNINVQRVSLITRYIGFGLMFIGFLIEGFVLGFDISDISLVFSSVFAILGIALFAIWSILSNITSGVIMFFSFPYKVGDKIEIHDKDFPITAIIEDIRAFHLHLRLENGDLVTYPNNLMLQKAVTLVQKDAIGDLL